MKIPEEAICSVCKQIFCCGKCREKHEIKKHAIRIVKTHVEKSAYKEEKADSIYVMCPICIKKPFPLHEVIYPEIIDHVKKHHLPLHCQKCDKIYKKASDLRNFSKCAQLPLSKEVELKNDTLMDSSCVLEVATKSATQTSPYVENHHPLSISSITPISIVNLQWNAKSKFIQDITDSTYSLKNASLITKLNSSRRSISSTTYVETAGKLVRTTSTPVQPETEIAKPKERTFNASGGQVSSIYNSGCDTENQNSPGVSTVAGGSNSTNPQPEAVQIYRKFNGRTKIAAVTPLRQVMSKSIQKAFAEHGLPSFSEQKAIEPNELVNVISEVSSGSPLDLRLSPALRRYQSASFNVTRIQYMEKTSRNEQCNKYAVTPKDKKLIPKRTAEKELTTESILITSTKQLSCFQSSESNSALSIGSVSTNSVYKTCQSFEIITSTEKSGINLSETGFSSNESNDELRPLKFKHPTENQLVGHNTAQITPITRLPGSSLNKKAIKFDTPKVSDKSRNNPATTEKFYTPISSPERNEENIGPSSAIDFRSQVVRNLSSRFSPPCRPSFRECAQSTDLNHYENEIDDITSNDDVFLETEVNFCSDQTTPTETGGFLKTIVNSIIPMPGPKKPKLISQRRGIHEKNISKTSFIKRCASIAGSLVRSTSLMDETQLQTLKRKRTHTIDSQVNSYKPAYIRGCVSSFDAAATDYDLSSTKRFRIQGRKPIERMRNSKS